MKVVGPDKTYIDYFQGAWCSSWCSQQSLSNRFGVRVREGLFGAVVEIGDGQVNACGKEFQIPLQLEGLPAYVSIIIYDHVLNYPTSDLMDVLSGKTSFQQALDYPPKIEPHRATALCPEQLLETAGQVRQRKSRG